MKVGQEAQTFLTSLFATPNPAQPGHMYSDTFLREQWDSEREAYASKKVAMQKQELELGRLLSLQDKQKALLLRVAQTPEQSIARVLESERLREEIVKQAEKVGTAEVFHTCQFSLFIVICLVNWVDIISTEQEDFLKLWYSKHKVALYYIALNEEKRPLQQSRADGHHSNIGQRGKTSVLLALRKRAAQLRKKVDTYRTRRAEYQAKYPAQQLPEDIDYNALNEIKADHPFWNDSIFTKLQDPWATDPKTRDGMRQLAYIDRAQEELRRLGWEVRRLMRWATSSHDRIWTCLQFLLCPTDSGFGPATPLISHPILSSLPPETQLIAASVILQNQYVKITNYQLLWNEDLATKN
ncbi:uncharacterized protein MELLADRAFT_67176 [Melampsora larici-populina 98AG31]|uniref:Uncharacterized protein n=1 Tax=Melampsora larici-populina (strain 98AG31 / pathotype 3-4-7) TaxID=747676 RepID=F4S229_MELLP|nr:uncharacterized protein MELLADRAFT_67176 [Melampsora larici-populina 98AG31]EGG01333.1 hypothetical protein MELLADRAFT_67176 [Melampsora larici-populina 98AG31]